MTCRTAHKASELAVALVLMVVVIASATQAGRIYWYCASMHQAMSHACCAERQRHADTNVVGDAQVVAPDCCQSRSLASLDVCAPTIRAEHEQPVQLGAPPPTAAIVGLPLAIQATQKNAEIYERIARSKLRTHARLMVFL